MGIDDLTRKFEISQEYLEKLKKGEISQEEFYIVYDILLKDSMEETSKIKKKLNDFEGKINYFKTSIVGLQKRLNEIEQIYSAFFEPNNSPTYSKHPFPEQIRKYEEQQAAQKEAEEKNAQKSPQ